MPLGSGTFFQAVFIVAVRVQKTISRPKGDQAMVRLKDIFLQFDFNNTIHPANTGTPTHTHNHTPTQTHRHPHNIWHMRTDIPRHSQTHTHTHPDTHKYVHTHTHSIHANPPAHTHTRTHIASIRTRAHRATTHIPGIHLPVILVRKNDRKMWNTMSENMAKLLCVKASLWVRRLCVKASVCKSVCV